MVTDFLIFPFQRSDQVGLGRIGPDVFQQPAPDLADEFVGRQCGVAAHDDLAGSAARKCVAGRFAAAPVGIGTYAADGPRLVFNTGF